MSYPLTSAYLKIERARKHLAELDREVRRTVAVNPYRLSIELEAETGQQVVRFRQVDDRPIRAPLGFGLMAGDVIHNLRSALDHVVYQLAIAGGGKGNRSQFPIFEDIVEYGRYRDQFLDGVVEEQQAIIEGLQPYRVLAPFRAGEMVDSERHPLAANVSLMNLARLDNIDKHRLLLPSEWMVPFRQPQFSGVARAEGTHPGDWYRVQDGAEYFRITNFELLPGKAMADVRVNADHPYTIGFGDPEWGPFGAANDVWSNRAKGFATKADLGVMINVVERVVGLFNPYFESLPP